MGSSTSTPSTASSGSGSGAGSGAGAGAGAGAGSRADRRYPSPTSAAESPLSHTYLRRDGCTYTPLVDGWTAFSTMVEAVDAAQHTVHIIVSFFNISAPMPDGRTFLQVMHDAVKRGVEVHLLFWHSRGFSATLNPDKEAFKALAPPDVDPSRPLLVARWDPSPHRAHSHHQKAWLIDADIDPATSPVPVKPTAFIGGINICKNELSRSTHDTDKRQRHDVYSTVTGPAVTDAWHTFVQRWNSCGGEGSSSACFPSPDAAGDLSFDPTFLQPATGSVQVRVSRTLVPDHYPPSLPVPDPMHTPLTTPLHLGDSSILMEYLDAVKGATSFMYFENQHFVHDRILNAVADWMDDGVAVVAVVPIRPMRPILDARKAHHADPTKDTRYARAWDAFLRCARHSNFTLVGLLDTSHGRRRDIYVHSKLCIVDDGFVTIGSANLVDLSLDADHSEMNASCWSEDVASGLRRRLVAEHIGELGTETDPESTCGKESGVDAMRRLKGVALANVAADRSGAPLKGNAVVLDAERYALESPAPFLVG